MFYKQHCENLGEIEAAIRTIELDLRRYISTQQNNNVFIYTKILSHLITCWAEVRILKLIYENNAFSNAEIDKILSSSTLEFKWQNALDIAISKAYNLNNTQNISSKLGTTPRFRYEEMSNLIKLDLLPSIELRNRIAHGQWKIAFQSDLKSISTKLTGQLRLENIVALQLKKKLLVGLAQTIHDLAVSPLTFERDFDKNFRLIEENKRNLHKRDYQVYKQKMIDKYNRGVLKRKSS